MNYAETTAFLYKRLPAFHEIGAKAFKPGLDTTEALCKANGNPEMRFPAIHVGGTNGKGSTSHSLASVLMEAGYKVGLYTSPHLKSFTERIKINGKEINQDFVVNFVDENLSYIDRFKPSFFELAVVMAFSFFAREGVDVAVIEVGMGGRLDSTNVITPILSVITNVSLDHVQYLGDTPVKIAHEKAGIIKPGVPVVVSEYQEDEIASVFEEKARIGGSPISYGSKTFKIDRSEHSGGFLEFDLFRSDQLRYSGLKMDLAGTYQLRNVCGILRSLEVLKELGYNVEDKAIYDGLASVVSNTGLKGRWQRLGNNPTIYCDTAHNVAGLSETIRQFTELHSTARRFVIGFVNDKDVSAILNLFPKDGIFYFCQPSNKRAFKVADLLSRALENGISGKVFVDVNLALEAAISDAAVTDTIYVGGSTFVVADLEVL